MYAGGAAGSHYTHRGGGTNYLCLPEQPRYSNYTAGTQVGRAYFYGAEYQTGRGVGFDGPLSAINDHNVPCAVCYTSTRETVVMIPARVPAHHPGPENTMDISWQTALFISVQCLNVWTRVLWISYGRALCT